MSLPLIYAIPGVRLLQTKLNLLTSYVPPPLPESHNVRKILMVHAHPVPDSFSASIANAFAGSAVDAGHEVKRISLYEHADPDKCYRPNLSQNERESYFSYLDDPDERRLSPEVKSHLDLLKWCDTLVFIYPTWWMNTPASVKGFIDRTLVAGLTWEFPNEKKKGASLGLVPKLENIEKIVGISTYGSSQTVVTLAGDNGRRMISNAVRHSVAPNASVLWLGLYGCDELPSERRIDFLRQVRKLPKDL